MTSVGLTSPETEESWSVSSLVESVENERSLLSVRRDE